MNTRLKFILLLCLLLVPAIAIGFEVDNVLIDPAVNPIRLKLAPEPEMELDAAVAPNAVLTPFLLGSEIWPGYLVEYRYVKYVVAVSCGSETTLPCSPLYVADDSNMELTVRYVQSSDDTFKTAEGLRVGSLFSEVTRSIPESSLVFSGNGECARLESGWLACFQKDDLALNPQTGQYRPGPNARIYRFIK